MSWLFPSSREMERETNRNQPSLSKEIEHKHPKCNYASMPPQNFTQVLKST